MFNRRYLDASLERELIAAQRGDHPVSLIMTDLDHFKAVNDSFGHLAGDEVLRVFAKLLQTQARGSDIPCRHGGEEFLVVLPRMHKEAAAARAEQLRAAVAGAAVEYGAQTICLTASFGVATFPADGRTGDELTAAVDHALYGAKEAGRDRIVCA